MFWIKSNIIWERIKDWLVIFGISILVEKIFSAKHEVVFVIMLAFYVLIENVSIWIRMDKKLLFIYLTMKLLKNVCFGIVIMLMVNEINIWQTIEVVAFICCFDIILVNFENYKDETIEENDEDV